MKKWVQSIFNPKVLVYTEAVEIEYADGLPHKEPPELIGYVLQSFFAFEAYIFHDKRILQQLPIGSFKTLLEAKDAVEKWPKS
ncbi:hypothetical protein [Runella zeae]|uniref:hypothetical protein n=1 Tax=Runella zeae TaxID=94255 RepID=UPI000428D5AA|nr:hypothetical protein [Runella zeae]